MSGSRGDRVAPPERIAQPLVVLAGTGAFVRRKHGEGPRRCQTDRAQLRTPAGAPALAVL